MNSGLKLDKETIVALSICMLLLFAWPYIFKTQPQAQPPDGGKEAGAGAPAQKPDQAPLPVKEVPPPRGDEGSGRPDSQPPVEDSIKKDLPPVEKPEIKQIPPQKLSSETVEMTVDPMTGTVKSILLLKHFKADGKTRVEIADNPLLKGILPGTLEVILPEDWILTAVECDADDASVEVRRDFRAGSAAVRIIQRWYDMCKYTLSYDVTVENSDSKKPILLESLKVSAGSMPPIMMLTGDVAYRDYQYIDRCLAGTSSVFSQAPEKKPFSIKKENPAAWISVSNKYFASMLIPEAPFANGSIMSSAKFNMKDAAGKDVECSVLSTTGITEEFSVDTGCSFTKKFKFFAGPKELGTLGGLGPNTTEVMHLGWKWLEPLSQILLKCLIWFNKYCANYGGSIILLTLLVRLIFWPASEWANVSMKKMQKIQPLVQELRVKYKDDPQKMNAKTMQLYKEHKVNPVTGCLPILLQLPVFLALYNTLDGAIELRHAPFLWAADLAKPDTVFSIPIPGVADLPLNPLILLMTATMFIQQKLTPTMADPIQQKMMLMMPFIMLFILYSLPSGLTLYWTISQTVSILQLLHNKYRDRKEKELELAAGKA